MRTNSSPAIACPNEPCSEHARLNIGDIALDDFSKVKWGRRRQFGFSARLKSRHIALAGFGPEAYQARREELKCAAWLQEMREVPV